METGKLLLFIGAGLLLNLTPGPDVLYIVTYALRAGVRAGAVAALGIAAGCLVHIFAAAIGVTALIATSSAAFSALKWVGTAYLVYVGLRMMLTRPPVSANRDAINPVAGYARPDWDGGLKSVFFRGFLTNALNPKVALFFLAFVPQFIAPDLADKALAFLLLGMLFNVNGLLVNLGWAVAAAWLGKRLGTIQKTMRRIERVAGLLFVGFGIRLALSDRLPG